MGVGNMGLQFALLGRRQGVNFTRTLMLGRQNHFLNADWVKLVFERFGQPVTDAEAEQAIAEPYAETLLRLLGAKVTDSMDASEYEDPTIIHDLNQPIPDRLKQQYTCIIDYGTLEHVFNFPVALKSMIDMLEVGGHVLVMTPANNFMGHGFYQFSPEVYYNFLGRNGFDQIEAYIIPYRWTTTIFRVADPRAIGSRVELCNPEPVQLGVIARKAKHVDDMITPIQSDYQDTFWEGRDIQRRIAAPAGLDPRLGTAVADLRARI